jgi:catechol 2,3-dioxygenase-like lactoylglutathione lyase family enzyme
MAKITGAHFLLYSKDPEKDRAFFRDQLGLRGVDAGEGWLIFRLPPAELGVHPADANFVQRHADHELLGAVLYLMCDDLSGLVRRLKSKKVRCAPMGEAPWGNYTILQLPSGGKIGLYQPSHPTAIRKR